MEFRTKVSNVAFFVIVTGGLLTAIGVFSVPSVFADKCDDNGDNNCNEADVNQKTWTNNKCELENLDSDHSNENFFKNTLPCVNEVRNLEDFATIPDQFAATS